MTLEAVKEQLLAADAKYAEWGFEGDGGPDGAALIEALFAQPVVEWNRIGDFLDVTMRLIAQRLLGPDHPPVYVQREKALLRPTIVPPHDGKKQGHTQCTAPTPCTFPARCTADSVHRVWHRPGSSSRVPSGTRARRRCRS